MSIIATVVKAALVLDQKVQAGVHKFAHAVASDYFQRAVDTENNAVLDAENKQLQLERLRASKAALLIKQHKAAMTRLHEGIDNELELVDGRKSQMLSKAKQERSSAVAWQSTAIRSDVAAEAARKAAEQLG
jgi:hypothetical protein